MLAEAVPLWRALGNTHRALECDTDCDPAALNLYLADPTGSERDLHRMSGKQAAFVAMRIGNNLVLLDKKTVQLQAAGSTSTSTGSLAAATTVVQGDQKTLSILLNFSDASVSCTPSDVANRLFGTTAGAATVNNNYQQSSRALVSFSWQAVGPYAIPYSSTGTCDYAGWATAANAAAPSGFSGSVSAPSLSIAAGASASASWSVTSATTFLPATYTVTANATDATNGNAGSNHASDIVYTDATTPTVSISSPSAGATLSAGRIALSASVSDLSAIRSVEFWVDSVLVATDSSTPYTANWNARKAAPGAHTITVRAYDAAGNVGQQAILVNVQ